MTNEYDGSYIAIHYRTFFRIARACFRELHLVRESPPEGLINFEESLDFPIPSLEEMEKQPHFHRQRLASVAVVFSALTLESFINDYGSWLDKRIFEALDRNSAAEKWRLFPLLRTGRTLQPGDTAMNGIQALFRLRDKLVHDKPREIYPPDVDSLDAAVAMNPIKHVQNAVTALYEVDSSASKDWAFEDEHPSWSHLL